MNNDISTFEKVIDVIEQDNNLALEIKDTLYFIFKRFFDVIISLIGLVFLLPIMFIIKICYMLTGDFKPVLFTQNRIGYLGKEFKFYKFRSMIPNADEELKRILKENKELAEEYRVNKKLQNDPRITKIGKFIRKTSIDELPQLINVFKGDMSLIGNRPYLPREKEDMFPYYSSIIQTKPGITGYWQTSGRSKTTFKKRLQLETYYSSNYSLGLDIKIFFRTFNVVLFGKSAK